MRNGIFLVLSTIALLCVPTRAQEVEDIGAPPVEINLAAIKPGLHQLEHADGKVVGVSGKFDIGLNSRTSHRERRVERNIGRFIRLHHDWFRLKREQEVKLRVREIEILDDYFHVARLDMYVGDLRVLDAELVATLWADGDLFALRGEVVVDHEATERSEMSHPDDTLHLLEDYCGHDHDEPLFGDDREFVSVVGNRFIRGDGATIEKGWSNSLGSVIWRAQLLTEDFLIDDETRTVVQGGTTDAQVTGPCNVRVRRFPTIDGRVSLLSAGNNTRTEQITCQADSFWNSCTWRLRRDPFGFPHGVQQVLDANGGELSRGLPCSSNAVPQFTNTNGDSLREHEAFYIANQMRSFMLQNVWSTQSPVFDPAVQIEFDVNTMSLQDVDNNPNTPPVLAFDVPSARFRPACAFSGVCPDIQCNSATGNCDLETLAHEYGHYVHWSLGHIASSAGGCTPGVNEGGSMNETLANAFAILFWLDDPESQNARYNATTGALGGNYPIAHLTGGLPLQHPPIGQCTGGTDGNGFNNPQVGQAFLTALWELMFNRNCQTSTCTDESSFNTGASQVFSAANQEGTLGIVGDALGFAVKTTPTNTSHQAIVAAMGGRLFFRFLTSDPSAASRAMRIFVHHGFACPLGSVGC